MHSKSPIALALSSLLSFTCACASEPAPKPSPSPATSPKKEPKTLQKHALDVPLEELSTETHAIAQYQLDACREDRIAQACHDLAQTLEDNHRFTVIDAFKQASAIACDASIADACDEISRPAPAELAPACSLDENVKPDGARYDSKELAAINQSYLGKNSERLEAIGPDLIYCATRSANSGDPYKGRFSLQFHVNSVGKARVTQIKPALDNEPFEACIVSAFERATFVAHDPLACAYYSVPLGFNLSK